MTPASSENHVPARRAVDDTHRITTSHSCAAASAVEVTTSKSVNRTGAVRAFLSLSG